MSKEELQQAAQVIDNHFRKRLQATGEPLQAVSNVIELKPDKTYLFVFKGDIAPGRVREIGRLLSQENIRGVALHLGEGHALEVIEANAQTEEGQA